MPRVPLASGFYLSDSLPLAAQECKNLYPARPLTTGASNNEAIFYTTGLKRFSTLGSSANRGMYVYNGFLYVVNGTSLYKLKTDGTFDILGTIEGTSDVFISDNSVVLCITVPRGKSYFVDSDIVEEITDTTFLGYGSVTSNTYKDGFFVFSTDSEIFVSSAYTENSGKNFNALDFATAEVKSDKNTVVKNIKNELYIIGGYSTEVMQNAGITGFPFVRINGAMSNFGSFSPFSVKQFDNNYAFVGSENGDEMSVFVGLPGTARKISTPAIDNIIQSYTKTQIQDITSWVYSQRGGIFYGINLPDRTLVYDAMASSQFQRPMWHERKTGSTRLRAENICEFNGKLYCGDNVDGRIGELTGYSEYGEAVERVVSGPYLQNEGRNLYISEVEIEMESGVGNPAGESDDNPVVVLSYSDDGGRTFTEFGSTAIGHATDYTRRQLFRRLGRCEHTRIFKFTTNNTNKIVYNGLIINLLGGT
jgi:hypothetical protein